MSSPSTWIKSNMLPNLRDSPKDKLVKRSVNEAEIKVQRCLEKLSIPDWYLNNSSKPPKILNTTPIELRPSPWKSGNRRQQSSNASVILQKYYDSPKNIGKPMNSTYGGEESFKPSLTHKLNNTASPMTKPVPNNKRELNTRVTKLRKAHQISKSFPKISPSRKIKHINLVFPAKKLAPDEKIDPSLDISMSEHLKKCQEKIKANNNLKPALLNLPLIAPKLSNNMFLKQDKFHRENVSSDTTTSNTTTNDTASNLTASNIYNYNNSTSSNNTSDHSSPAQNLCHFPSGVNLSISGDKSQIINQNFQKEGYYGKLSCSQENSANIDDSYVPKTINNSFGKYLHLCSTSISKSQSILKTINENNEDPPDHPPPPPPLEISTATFTRTKGKSFILLQKELEEQEEAKKSPLFQQREVKNEKKVIRSERKSILPQVELQEETKTVSKPKGMLHTIRQMKLKQQELEAKLFPGKSPILPISRQKELTQEEAKVKLLERKLFNLPPTELKNEIKEVKRPSPLPRKLILAQESEVKRSRDKSPILQNPEVRQRERDIKILGKNSPILRQIELKREMKQLQRKSPILQQTAVKQQESKETDLFDNDGLNLDCDTSLVDDIVEELRKKCQMRTCQTGIPRSSRHFVKKLVQVLERSHADDKNSIVISSSSSSAASSHNNSNHGDDFEDDELGSAFEALSTSSGVISGSISLKNSDGEDLYSSISPIYSPDYDWSMQANVNFDETKYQDNAEDDFWIPIPKKLPHLPRSSTLLSVFSKSIRSGRSSGRSSGGRSSGRSSLYKSPSISPIRCKSGDIRHRNLDSYKSTKITKYQETESGRSRVTKYQEIDSGKSRVTKYQEINSGKTKKNNYEDFNSGKLRKNDVPELDPYKFQMLYNMIRPNGVKREYKPHRPQVTKYQELLDPMSNEIYARRREHVILKTMY